MRLKPKLAWFSSEKGRKAVLAGTCFAGLSAFSINYFPQTFLLEKYKDVVQMYRGGVGVAVPSKVLSQAEHVMDIMKLAPKDRSLIRFFTVYGFDPMFAGSTYTRTGAYIGVPSNFSYEKISDIEKNMIIVNGEPVKWGSKAGQEMLSSIVLSEQARQFAIATQIHQVLNPQVFLHSSTATLCIFATYSFAHNMNKRLNAFTRPPAFRFILYALIGSFMGGVWSLMKDLTTVSFENKADKEVAMLSPELAQGGLDFYTQVLRRNVSLRELMGSKGESLYAASGNPHVLLRTKHLPITLRRDNLENYLKDLSNQNNNDNISNQ